VTGAINSLSPAALAAAMKGGMDEWGMRASSLEHVRYCEPIPKQFWRRRRMCRCGCRRRETYSGKANGIALASGCELSMRRWVRDPLWRIRRRMTQISPAITTPTGDAP
jgi:hypothetical protein